VTLYVAAVSAITKAPITRSAALAFDQLSNDGECGGDLVHQLMSTGGVDIRQARLYLQSPCGQ
jgi:hypothetical protein